jgi:hypothetical protein
VKTNQQTTMTFLALTGAVMIGGCSASIGAGSDNSTGTSINHCDTTAAGLRVTLDTLLREHVVLALSATDGALGGRNDEFTAAANALDANSQELAAAIGSVYGQAAQDAFLPLWRKHIGFLVDYTQGVAANDEAKKTKAVNDLIGYTQDFGAFIESATGGKLKKDAVADLVKTHVVGLKEAVDAQAAKDWATAYSKERDAEKHMDVIGNILAETIAEQFPDKF